MMDTLNLSCPLLQKVLPLVFRLGQPSAFSVWNHHRHHLLDHHHDDVHPALHGVPWRGAFWTSVWSSTSKTTSVLLILKE